MADDIVPFGVASAGEASMQPPNVLDRLLSAIISGTVSVPKRVIDAAAATAPPGLRREDYTDAPAPQGTAAFGLSPQAWQPGDEMRAQSIDAAANLAGVGTSFAVPGAAGVFGGRLAATADKAALAKAEEMAAAGADRKAIWDQTGWFKGSDDKWRFEIPDNKAVMNLEASGAGELERGDYGRVAGLLHHKDLYAAYPDLRNANMFVEKGPSQGSYNPSGRAGREELNVSAYHVDDARPTALHEAQHAIQEREGFARGGSPSQFTQADDARLARDALAYRRELADLDPHLSREKKDEIIRKRYAEAKIGDMIPDWKAREVAHNVEDNPSGTLERVMQLYGTDQSLAPFAPSRLYRELPGEIEARNVSYRSHLTPEQLRAKPPWETADMQSRPIMNQIFGTGRVGSLEGLGALNKPAGPQMSLPMDDAARLARAKDQGFVIDAFHGSPGRKFREFDARRIGQANDPGLFGEGFYVTPSRSEAVGYAGSRGHVRDLKVKSENPLVWDFSSPEASAGTLAKIKQVAPDYWQSIGANGVARHKSAQFSRDLKSAGYDSVIVKGPDGSVDQMVVLSPSQLRDKNAKFDSARAGSSNLMAGILAAAPVGMLAASGSREER